MSITTATHPPRALGRWAPLPVVLAGTFMVVLDFFIVNVALPSMQARLHASSGAIEWVVAGYSLTSAVFLVAGGKLGDRHGRRAVFAAGLALFTLASAACGFAPSPDVLVAARLVQGVGAALVMPNVLTLLAVLYDGADRARALAAYGLTMGVAAVSGQLIGGALISGNVAGLGWRSVFLINLPVGAVALALAPRAIPESRAPGAPRIDLSGTALLTAGLTALVLPLLEGRSAGWPVWTWLSLAACPPLLAAFWARQRTLERRGESDRALIAPALLRRRGVADGLLAQLVFWCGQASFFLVLALYLQQGRGLSALHSGLVFTILALAYLAASMRAPALTERHGSRVLAAGALTLAAGHVALLATVGSIGVGGPVLALAPGLILVGAGMGLGITPLASIVLASTPPEHAGAASGAVATAQNVGGAIGVAVIGVVFFGAVGHGVAGAFQLSTGVLAALLLAVAALSRRLPRPHAGPQPAPAAGAELRAEAEVASCS
jgi:EmrB/QacA subfamily drug resistance transporter